MSLVLIDSKSNTATLIVRSKKHGTFQSQIDLEDAHRVAEHQWRVNKRKNRDAVYFQTHIPKSEGKQTVLQLHRCVMSASEGVFVDHRNPADTLDNRKSNLRLATHAENMRNMRSHVGGSSRFKGVTWSKWAGKWQAQINSKTIGRFDSELEAAVAYNEVALELFGDFAHLNQVAA
jgi:HNH endonuclease/AP2 domain